MKGNFVERREPEGVRKKSGVKPWESKEGQKGEGECLKVVKRGLTEHESSVRLLKW